MGFEPSVLFFHFFQKTIADFNSIAGFLRVIGVIDGSLIAIKGPDNEEHLYVCHKGFHAINVMAVCNAQLLPTNFLSKWHGSVHDSAVFHSSALQVHMENGGDRNGWLLGDRSYGIQPYLMTPFRPEMGVPSGSGQKPEGPYQKDETPSRGPLACGRQGLDV